MEQPNEQTIRELARKWLAGTITEAERESLDKWYEAEYETALTWTGDEPDEAALHSRLFREVQSGLHVPVRNGRIRKLTVYLAAAAVLLIAMAAFLLFPDRGEKARVETAQSTSEIVPGGNKATLVLADGRQISLSNEKEGIVIGEEHLSYHDGTELQEQIPLHAGRQLNEVRTPPGGKYQVLLPDGSKVWLNASSGIRFPAVFGEKERRVELIGEAYFEIKRATDPGKGHKKFVVTANGQSIEVLGTHFNVNAYQEEGYVVTTLLEGSVRVHASAEAESRMLRPGQQSWVSLDGHMLKLADADTAEALAWKNNLFRFKGADIRSAMRQIARWYDVEVVFEGKIKEGQLTGYVSRDLPVTSVLRMLEEIGEIHFALDGRVITAIPRKNNHQ